MTTRPAPAQPATEIVLHSFKVDPNGGPSETNLTLDPAGNLDGTSYLGGTAGLGIVHKVDTAGHEKVLYNFTDQCFPSAVVLDTAGNLYGACFGIASTYAGVVFKLDSTGLETVLHTFTGGADGANPIGVILDSAGNLYGATQYGGAGGGVAYKWIQPEMRRCCTRSWTMGTIPVA